VRRIAIINQKGGVGKTTTAVNLGAALARRGIPTLLLDLDPQANLTLHLDRRPEAVEHSIFSVLVDGMPMRDAILPTATQNLWVLPSGLDLAGVEQALANRIGRETLLLDAIEGLVSGARREADEPRATEAHAAAGGSAGDGEPADPSDPGGNGNHPEHAPPPPSAAAGPRFEFILMDCPPSLGLLSINALAAATEVLVPLQTEFFALQGLSNLMEVVTLVRRRINPTLRLRGILPCMVDARTRLSSEVIKEVQTHFAELLLGSSIRTNVRLAEAPSFGKTIFEYAPDSNGAQDYEALATEMLGPVSQPV
jgi:chromosome partitioning protein